MDRLLIENLDRKAKGVADYSFKVMFNPTEYTFEDASKWQEHGTAGGYNPELQYAGGDRRRLSMELFYDTYEDQTDVRLYTGKLAELLLVTINKDNDGRRPPKLQLSWGGAPANGRSMEPPAATTRSCNTRAAIGADFPWNCFTTPTRTRRMSGFTRANK